MDINKMDCPWLNVFKNVLSSKKSLLHINDSDHILSWSKFAISTLIKTDQCSLNGQYSSNKIVRDSNFLILKDFWNRKKCMSFSWKLDRIFAKENNCQPTVSLMQFFNRFLRPIDIWALSEHFYKILELIICVKPYRPWWNFLNTFLNSKRIWALSGNFYKVFGRSIWLKPQCNICSFLINVWITKSIRA